MKIYNDALFENDGYITYENVVVRPVNNPDKYKGKYPYFGEMYRSEDIMDMLYFLDLDIEVCDEIHESLSGLKYKYPLEVVDGGVGSGRQDRSLYSKVATYKSRFEILKFALDDANERKEEYLNVTYENRSSGEGESVGLVGSESRSESKNESEYQTLSSGESSNESNVDSIGNTTSSVDSNSESDQNTVSAGTSSSNTDTTSSSNSKGKSDNKTTSSGESDSNSSSNSRDANIDLKYPDIEINDAGNGSYSPGVGVLPGNLSLKYLDKANESANISSGNVKGTESGESSSLTNDSSESSSSGNSSTDAENSSSGSSNSLTVGKTSSVSDNTGNTKSEGSGSTSNEVNNDSSSIGSVESESMTDSTSNTKDKRESDGRGRDLMSLSLDLQSLAKRKALVEFVTRTLKPCLSSYVSSFSTPNIWIGYDIYD